MADRPPSEPIAPPDQEAPLSIQLAMASDTLAAMMKGGEFMLAGAGTVDSLRGRGAFLDQAAREVAALELRARRTEGGFEPIRDVLRRVLPRGYL